MDFGKALEALKEGRKACRDGWNGKDMYVVLCFPVAPEHTKSLGIPNPSGFFSFINCDEPLKTLPFLVIKTAQGDLVPWLASQTDILAEDWWILPTPTISQKVNLS